MRFAILILIMSMAACGGVVRDGAVYRQELALYGRVTAQLAEQQLAEAGAAARSGDVPRCRALAEVALIGAVAVPYHLAMSLFLADLAPDPGPPPEVPAAATWCAAQVTAAPAIWSSGATPRGVRL